jgi:hypothetical protein
MEGPFPVTVMLDLLDAGLNRVMAAETQTVRMDAYTLTDGGVQRTSLNLPDGEEVEFPIRPDGGPVTIAYIRARIAGAKVQPVEALAWTETFAASGSFVVNRLRFVVEEKEG